MQQKLRVSVHIFVSCAFVSVLAGFSCAQSQMPWTQTRCDKERIREAHTPEPMLKTDPESQLIRSIRLCEYKRTTELIQNGANLNFEDESGNSVLDLALGAGQNSIIQELLQHGAKPDQTSSKTSRQTALMGAALTGNIEAARLLLVYGADPNKKNAYGSTALMYAAERGNNEIVKLLLTYGADPGLRNKSGRSARDSALRANHAEIAELLSSYTKK